MALLDLSQKKNLLVLFGKQVMIALIKSQSFKASEISSDMISAKVEQAIHDHNFQVEIIKVKLTLSKLFLHFHCYFSTFKV